MILKTELVAIQQGFGANKVLYAHDATGALDKFSNFEIDFYTVACSQLIYLCTAHVKTVKAGDAAAWLIKAIFPTPKRAVFVTGKDCHIHVMVALDTLVAVAQ